MVGYAPGTNRWGRRVAPRVDGRGRGNPSWRAVMATFEKPKPSGRIPDDLLPVIYESGVLSERQFADLRNRVLKGEYPDEPTALAERLVAEKVLTDYQARRF